MVANTCAYAAPRPLVAFAFRVHAHALGRNVSLESLVGGHNPDPRAEVTTLKTKTLSDGPFQFHAAPVMRASRDSRLPQMFEELSEAAAFALLPGSKVRVTCAFDTTSRDALTRAGWGHDDEMCNLYLMVHAEEPVYLGCVGDARYGAGPHGVAARMTVEHSPKVRLVPIRPRRRGERRSLRTFPVVSLRPGSLAFNTRPRRLSTSTDAFQLHPDIIFKDARGGGGGGRGGGVAPDPSELRAHVVPPPSRRKSWPREIGQVGGVAVEPDGRHVWVFHTARRGSGTPRPSSTMSIRCLPGRRRSRRTSSSACARSPATSSRRSARGSTTCLTGSLWRRTGTCGSRTSGRTRCRSTTRRRERKWRGSERGGERGTTTAVRRGSARPRTWRSRRTGRSG